MKRTVVALALACMLATSTARADDGVVRFEANYARRSLFGLWAEGADVEMAPRFCASDWFRVWAPVRATYVRTPEGLSIASARVGGEAEFVWWRLHAGVGAGLLLVGFRRATDASWVLAPGLAVTASGRVDVVTLGRATLFAEVSADAAVARRIGAGESAPWLGAGAGLGVEIALTGTWRDAQ